MCITEGVSQFPAITLMMLLSYWARFYTSGFQNLGGERIVIILNRKSYGLASEIIERLSRYMAAGSVLFRPFAMTGELYSAATLGAAGTPDATIYTSATGVEWKYTTPANDQFQVGGAFLASLLTAPT